MPLTKKVFNNTEIEGWAIKFEELYANPKDYNAPPPGELLGPMPEVKPTVTKCSGLIAKATAKKIVVAIDPDPTLRLVTIPLMMMFDAVAGEWPNTEAMESGWCWYVVTELIPKA